MIEKLPISKETVDSIYRDGFQSSISESGKLVGRVPRAINAAFSKLDCWILKRENNVEQTKLLLEKNLENVDPDKIVPPEPYVAVPTIQALSYSMDSDELRSLYANLLAKSIYSDTKDAVHPAFVEIIKNLSPLDIRVFNAIMGSQYQEIGCYEMRLSSIGESAFHVIYPYITEITISSVDAIASSIDNLSRNKLIATEDFHYSDDKMYLPIRETSFYQGLLKIDFSQSSSELRPYKMAIKSTSFGKKFYNICATPL